MIDLRLLRENPELVRASQRARGADESAVDTLLSADAARRTAVANGDALRAEQKELGRTIGRASAAERPALLTHGKELSDAVKAAQAAEATANERLSAAHRAIPNVIIHGVAAGGEDDFTVLKHVGEPRTFDFEPLDHLELGEKLMAIDMERGAKVSGTRFYFLRGVGARLQWAMFNLAISRAIANDYVPMVPPVLVKPESMDGTGYLGEHATEVYHLPDDELYLVGTSEVPMAAYHADEILDLSSGPVRYAGQSSCFRREAGSYGKDTRGIIRVHQFEKVEMFVYCKPEDAEDQHRRLLDFEKEMLDDMELPYRVIDVAAGDLGTSAARKFDCEAWVPTQQAYRELTSTSNCTTFQARRLSVRYRDDEGKPQIAATLNGTLATTRWMVAILENHQQSDGSVVVPAALRPFLGMDVLEPVA